MSKQQTQETLSRPFTKYDWDGLAGAESFDSENNPRIFEWDSGTFASADRNGIQVFLPKRDVDDCDATYDCWNLDMEGQKETLIIHILEIVARMQINIPALENLGFEFTCEC